MIKLGVLLLAFFSVFSIFKNEKPYQPNHAKILYTMPEESEKHEGTWLQWPHQYQYGITYRNRLDQTWIDMTKALVSSEKVHLIVYDEEEKSRVEDLLEDAGVSMQNINFRIYKTDDVWVRDNGPIYVRDRNGELVIQDWGFNGWGEKAKFENCDAIPKEIANEENQQYIDLNEIMIIEGGSVEIDGHGTLMACKSSILNRNRNPRMAQEDAEEIFTKYLGATNFIWLEGIPGLEITDQHIDGFARFGNAKTIVTMNEESLLEFQVLESDIETLYNAKNKYGKKYKLLKLPLTEEEVTTEYGKPLGYKGSYCNYYIANKVVLVPNYNDHNDAIANAKIQALYPTRKVIGIDVRNLYENGGMVHCVTQQQPAD